jgi:hypothetical protein
LHHAHRLAGIEDPQGIATIVRQDFEQSEAGAALAAFTKEFWAGDVVLTAWNDSAEIVDAHTGGYARSSSIRFEGSAFDSDSSNSSPLCRHNVSRYERYASSTARRGSLRVPYDWWAM